MADDALELGAAVLCDDAELADVIGLSDSTSADDGVVNTLWRAQQAVETGDAPEARVVIVIRPAP